MQIRIKIVYELLCPSPQASLIICTFILKHSIIVRERVSNFSTQR